MLKQQNHRFRRFTGSDIQHTRVFQSLYLVRYLLVSYWQVSGNKIDEHVKQQFPLLCFFFLVYLFSSQKCLKLIQNVSNTSPIIHCFCSWKQVDRENDVHCFWNLKLRERLLFLVTLWLQLGLAVARRRPEKASPEWASVILYTAVILELSHHLRAGNYVSSL